ncbi:E3 ISG15--protein ligase HERC5 [Gracilaria domingensis]|nr:E3 ISG15--protein ligase HERC5 [Gracilaria domingensis]
MSVRGSRCNASSDSPQQRCFPSPLSSSQAFASFGEAYSVAPSAANTHATHMFQRVSLSSPDRTSSRTKKHMKMGSYPVPLPNGLAIFAVLPQHLVEHMLFCCDLTANDLSALKNAALVENVLSLAYATEVAAAVLVYAHPNGKALVENKLPSETWISLLRYLQRLDGAAAPMGQTEVWSCGRNDLGQGVRPDHNDQNALTATYRVASEAYEFERSPANLIIISAGSHHSVAVSELGVLHVAGANHRGQLGLGDLSLRTAWTPVVDLKWARVAQVACGLVHTVVLTGQGLVLVTGANEFGQLGLGNCAQQTRFSKLELMPARMIAAGNAHTVVLLEDGTAWGTGDNSRGQLGGRRGGGRDKFAPIGCFGRKVVRVACGSDTTMLLTADNMVLVTGKRHGGLSVIGGLGMSRVTHLSVGEGFAVASTDESEVAVSLHRKRFHVTDELLHISAASVSAGLSHYAITTDDGCAFATGTNTFGQIAAGEMGLTIEGSQNARVIRPHRVSLSRVQIPKGYRALRAAAGMFHTLYLLEKDPPCT